MAFFLFIKYFVQAFLSLKTINLEENELAKLILKMLNL